MLVTVCCKLTYELAPSTSSVATAQVPIAREDQHWGSDSSRSLYMPADLVPTKRMVDVMVVGSAYAPRGTTVRSLDVKLGVGPFSKTLRLVGDRTRQADGSVSREQPFASMPLVYERAAGGAGTSNPVGIGAQSPVVPNIEALSPSSAPGFGPLASFWPGRTEGRQGEGTALPSLEELESKGVPSGLAETAFQSAPPDQRLPALPAELDLELVHLHPEHAHLRTRLPGYYVQASEVRSGTSAMTNLRPDTLLILTDRGLATVTYRGTFVAQTDELSIALGIVPAETGLPFNEQTRPLDARVDAREAASPRLAAMTQPKPIPARKYQTITSVDARPPGAPAIERSTPPSTPSAPPPPAAPPSYAAHPSAPPMGAPLSPVGLASAVASGPSLAPSPSIPSSPPIAPPLAASALTPSMSRPTPSAAPLRAAPDPVPPPRLVPSMMSAFDASNRAADGPGIDGAVAAPAKPKHEEALALLWFDEAYAPALRRVEEWRKLLRKAEERADKSMDSSGESAASIEDTRDFTEVLRAGKPRAITSIETELRGWIGSSAGTKARPALLVRGALSVVFDERSTLRALVSAARPFAKLDTTFGERVAEAAAFASEADDLTPSGDLVAAARTLREAFASADRKVPPTHLEERATATLAARRAYKEVEIWGARFVPVLLAQTGDATAVRSGYLPKTAADRLPLVARVEVRAIVEVVPSELPDDGDAAFRVRALARHLSLT